MQRHTTPRRDRSGRRLVWCESGVFFWTAQIAHADAGRREDGIITAAAMGSTHGSPSPPGRLSVLMNSTVIRGNRQVDHQVVPKVALNDPSRGDRDCLPSAADSPKIIPPSAWAVALSVLTTSPQSITANTSRTRSLPSGVTATCATSATIEPKHCVIAIPRPSPPGSGLPQPDKAATRTRTSRKSGASFRRSSRKRYGSLPVACAISSMNDSLKNPCCELSTDRHAPVRTGWAALRAAACLSGTAYGMYVDSLSPPPA